MSHTTTNPRFATPDASQFVSLQASFREVCKAHRISGEMNEE